MASSGRRQLLTVKLVHTAVSAFFVACIVAIPILGWLDELLTAVILAGVVFVEVLVLMLNGWRCPLTPIAAKHTADRRDNFDIFLPEWLARYNKGHPVIRSREMASGERTTTGLIVLLAAGACGGSRVEPAVQPVSSQDVARAEAMGISDLEGLSCAAVALAPLVGIVREFVPGAGAIVPGAPAGTGDNLARSAQQTMAASDSRAANLRAASQAQIAAAQAASVGDHTRAARENANAVDLLHRTLDVGAAPGQRPRRAAGSPSEDASLLEEYASDWALMLTTPDSAEVAKARVARVDEMDPQVMEDYVDVLLYAYRSFDLGCAGPAF